MLSQASEQHSRKRQKRENPDGYTSSSSNGEIHAGSEDEAVTERPVFTKQSSVVEWMTTYNQLRKTLHNGRHPSPEDTKWLSQQIMDMKNFSLSPERTELLKQAINIMSFNTQPKNKRAREETTSTTPSSPVMEQSPPGSPRDVAPSSPCKSSRPMKRNQLSSWMCTQRQDNKAGELPEYRIKLLNLTGFTWSKHHKQQQQRMIDCMSLEETLAIERELLATSEVISLQGRAKRNHELWMVRYHELLAFKRQHGHLKVPTLVPEDE